MGIGFSALKLGIGSGAAGNGMLRIHALTNTRRVKAGEVLLRKQK